MRSVAILLALGYVLGCALAALLMVFVAWFPVENLSPGERAEDDWLALASPVVLVLSVVTSVTVVRGRPWWATAALAAQTVVGIGDVDPAARGLS